jgi:hypothetical protein
VIFLRVILGFPWVVKVKPSSPQHSWVKQQSLFVLISFPRQVTCLRTKPAGCIAFTEILSGFIGTSHWYAQSHPYSTFFLRPHSSLAQSPSPIHDITHLSTGICSYLALSPVVWHPSILTNTTTHRLNIISRVAFGHNPPLLLRLHPPLQNMPPIMP